MSFNGIDVEGSLASPAMLSSSSVVVEREEREGEDLKQSWWEKETKDRYWGNLVRKGRRRLECTLPAPLCFSTCRRDRGHT